MSKFRLAFIGVVSTMQITPRGGFLSLAQVSDPSPNNLCLCYDELGDYEC
jgi:hypothetical protein